MVKLIIHLYVRDVAGLFINSLYGHFVNKSMVLQSIFQLIHAFFCLFCLLFRKII